jgi:preprotein translocase subunit SecA
VTDIEPLIKQKTKENVTNEISLSLGEYLEDYENPQSWDVAGLCKWAMSAFKVNLSPSKVKQLPPEEIEELLTDAACEQIDKKDCSPLVTFLKEDFTIKTLCEWARAKFDVRLDAAKLKDLSKQQIGQLLIDETSAKYKKREIEYPVEFAMNMVYGSEMTNVYGFETLAQWAKKKYGVDFSVEQIQNAKPIALQKQLLELSEKFNNDGLDNEIVSKMSRLDTNELAKWANERFDASLSPESLEDKSQLKDRLKEAGIEFLRSELSDLEKYVLLQVYDSTWKDHLYAMDQMKSNIHFRAFAEKDPKIEYKREGFRMFNEMLETIEDHVTNIIFKIRLEAGARTRNVWNVSQTAHDEVGQFAMAEQQRAAAQAPQGEQKVKQIKLEQPKVGRNDPCPCGSGKKYKKCCGQKR